MVANSKLMNTFKMIDLLGTEAAAKLPVTMAAALLAVDLPAGGFAVLAPEIRLAGGYSADKRVQ